MEAMNICGNYSNEIGVCVLKIEFIDFQSAQLCWETSGDGEKENQ